MGIQFLSRAEYCKLAGLEIEQYSILRRREQLPTIPSPDLSEEARNNGGFEAAGALYLIVADELVERYQLSRDSAAAIAANGLHMHSRWADISASSAQVGSGKEPDIEILFAVIDWPGLDREKTSKKPLRTVAIGTLEEIADQHPRAHNIIAISLTRCAAVMRQRAAKARISLDEFWET